MKTTFFAPAERASIEQLKADHALLRNSDYITTVINALPDVVAILNKERQIIFGNQVLLKFLGVDSEKQFLGLRLGEAVKCVNSALMEGGCGTSEKCRYCGAVKAVLESQYSNKKVTNECRIITNREDKNEFLDLKVTSAPFTFQNKEYSILTIDDISDAKRKDMLERIFFHDIINIAGGLKGLSEILNETDNTIEQTNEYLGLVNDMSKELLEEIMSQRALSFAEKNELQPVFSCIETLSVLHAPVTYLSHHSISRAKIIGIDKDAFASSLVTDAVLLKRVLINMLKNALEASADGDKVDLNCKKEGEFIIFSVRNKGFMPPEVQAQVFQRSFSTKGNGRGLGTYSIKLLTERYLKGSVGFTSSIESGTEFFVRLPIDASGLSV
ncbi:MAG: ATP-binding protein [Chitinophagaceae bacterium]|nr:ATP-binding protein [Chitinophagaceae bacterium]